MKFYQLPKELLHGEAFNGLDGWAIILYSVMLDRKRLSEVNSTDFSDKDGSIYIIFTIQEVMKLCRCAKATATKLIKQLTNAKLIETRQQGQGKPNIIYVNELSTATGSEVQILNFKKSNKYTSKGSKNELQEVQNLNPSNTNNSNTDFNNTNNIYNAACGKVDFDIKAFFSDVVRYEREKQNKAGGGGDV
ncbi:MAG: replication initiator protein A [Treponema sp.]|nr:replication initiator protein A [Treponema sp.]